MITFLKTEAIPHWGFDIKIHSMTQNGHEVETCEINSTDLYKITFFDQKLSTLKTYTGKVVHYTLSKDDYPTYNYGSKRVKLCKCITSLVLDCSEESESKTITIDICDIRGIKRYSEEAFEEISSGTIKEWK